MTIREWAALMVAYNWRIQQRLPRVTEYALSLNLLNKGVA